MNKKVPITIISLLLAILLLLTLLNTTGNGLREGSQVNPDNIKQLMEEQVDIGPRYPGSNGSLEFKNWITNKVTQGWTLEIQNFTHMGVELRNYWITSSTTEQWPSVMIGAHYDSRKVANEDSTNPTAPVPGANDGASGVAAILEMMTHITTDTRDDFGFVLFDGEDQGSGGMEGWDWIVGSTYFANQMTHDEIDATEMFILYDMIADDELILEYEGYSNDSLSESIWTKAHQLGYDYIFKKEYYSYITDDHVPFHNLGIPTVDLIDLDYPEWHTTEDTMENVSPENAAIVVDVVLEWIYTEFSFPTQSQPLSSPTDSSINETNGFEYILVIPVLILSRKIST